MRRAIATACVLAMMAGGVWAQTSDSQAPAVPTHQSHGATTGAKTKKRAASKKNAKAAAPAHQLPAQTMPPVPATLMNRPPVRPNVTMERGLLTIDAPNSTLNDVLDGVRKATGAAIEGASPTERVAVRLGPGEPEQVIAALLRGTPYDYVILGSLERQDVVTRVVLTQPSSLSASSPTGGGQPEPDDMSGLPGAPGQRSGMSPHQPQMDNIQPVRTPPEEVATQPDGEQEQAQQPQPAAPQQEPSKTPDQLFKELQQLGLGQPGQLAQPKPPQ
jgi:hypothetical protein